MATPPPIALGSIGMADSLILMVLALVVFGPRRLPQIGRQIGKLMYEFRKASNDFKFQMEEELRISEEEDRRKKEEERRRQLVATQASQQSVSAPPALAQSIAAPAADPQLPASTTEPDAAPRILPPSTGETVAVDRRSELAELTEPPADSASSSSPASSEASTHGSAPPADAAKSDSAPAMETASHNG
jgi:sec-independent protein translocase protein TatB